MTSQLDLFAGPAPVPAGEVPPAPTPPCPRQLIPPALQKARAQRALALARVLPLPPEDGVQPGDETVLYQRGPLDRVHLLDVGHLYQRVELIDGIYVRGREKISPGGLQPYTIVYTWMPRRTSPAAPEGLPCPHCAGRARIAFTQAGVWRVFCDQRTCEWFTRSLSHP